MEESYLSELELYLKVQWFLLKMVSTDPLFIYLFFCFQIFDLDQSVEIC